MKAGFRLIQACLLVGLFLQAATSGAQPVIKVVASGFTLFLKSDGSLWGMGNNAYGQLGDGTTNNCDLPELITNGVAAIAAGGSHSLFIRTNGSLWVMGYNNYGQLGDGTTNNSLLPEQIVPGNVTAISGGLYHSLFVQSDGSMWAMGNNSAGQLGNGTYNNTNRPVQIMTNGVMAVAAGDFHSLFLKTNGSLWGMGYNGENGQGGALGDGTYNSTNKPEQIVTNGVMVIAAGSNFSLFIKTNGSLWAMGDDSFGQLGDGGGLGGGGDGQTETNRPEQIVPGNVTTIVGSYFNTLFIKSDGSLWGMGNNQSGQLGEGIIAFDSIFPEQIVASNVTAIAAGFALSLFVKNDGSLWGMGDNTYGQLGNGTFGNPMFYYDEDHAFPPQQILAAYNQISGQLFTNGDVQLSFVGIAGARYALDVSSSLSPANWLPLATNPASSYGPLCFTNTPAPTTNHFWRIRSVP
jgi:alpha-tubulin suppressor-like RCC1 family protein